MPAFHEIGVVLAAVAAAATLLALRLPSHAPEVTLDTISARSDSGTGHQTAGE